MLQDVVGRPRAHEDVLCRAFRVSLPTRLGVMIFLSFIAAAMCVTCSWGHAFSALRISECPSLPSNRGTAEYLRIVEPEQQKIHIYNCYIDTLEELKKAIDAKSKPLELVYKELVWGAGFFMILAILTTIRELTVCPKKRVQNNENITPAPSPTTEYQRRSEEPVVNRQTPPEKR